MQTLVCKPFNAFVEPCCAQFNLNVPEGSALFSSDVVTTYAYLKKKLGQCAYAELPQPYSDAGLDELAGFGRVVLFAPFPRSREAFDDLLAFTLALRRGGAEVALLCRRHGYLQQAVDKYDLCDVAIQSRDSLACMEILAEAGWFEGKSWSGQTLLDRQDVKPWKECHGQYSFLHAPEILRDPRYRTMPKYRKQRSLTSGYGCRNSCTFCQHRHTPSHRKNPKILAAEVSVWDGGMELFDTNLFQHRAWLEEFLEAMAAYPSTTRSIRTLGRIDDMHRSVDLLPACREIGIDAVNIGLESGSERILEAMKKNNDLEYFEELAAVMTDLGIEPLMNVLVGMPDEDDDSLLETFELLTRHQFRGTSCSLLRPLPGTPVYDEVISEGLARPEDLDLDHYLDLVSQFTSSQAHVPTRNLSVEELAVWHERFKSEIGSHNSKGFKS